MIDISRGFNQISLHNNIIQKSSENLKSLRCSIKVLKPLKMYKSEKKVRTFAFHRKVFFFFCVMDFPLYNELNLQKGIHIAI